MGLDQFIIFSEELNDQLEDSLIVFADKKLWINVRATKSGIRIQSIYTETVSKGFKNQLSLETILCKEKVTRKQMKFLSYTMN